MKNPKYDRILKDYNLEAAGPHGGAAAAASTTANTSSTTLPDRSQSKSHR